MMPRLRLRRVPGFLAGTLWLLISGSRAVLGAESVAQVRDYVANASVTAFFYLWYGNPKIDGRYLHWDHFLLPHWTEQVNERYKGQVRKYHNPDMKNLHSPFYPLRGPYSSRDPKVIRSQLTELRDHGVDIVALSWWGRPDREESADSQGVSTDDVVPLVLKEADALGGIRVGMHLEPYPGRSVETVRDDLSYLVEQYGSHPSFLPLYYVYDSYHISSHDWSRLLTAEGDASVRGTSLDGVMLGLWLEGQHGEDIAHGGFDGFYTYFASQGFSYGSTASRWPAMVDFANQRGLLSVLSVGPGYDDTKIRPWNDMNTKDREGGAYLDRMFSSALRARPSAVSLTSYNEWGEGTQLEPAVPFECDVAWEGNDTHLAISPYTYQSYPEGDALFYLKKVEAWGGRFKARASVGEMEGGKGFEEEEAAVEGGLLPHDPEEVVEEEQGWEEEEVVGEDEPVGDLTGLMMGEEEAGMMMEQDEGAGVQDL